MEKGQLFFKRKILKFVGVFIILTSQKEHKTFKKCLQKYNLELKECLFILKTKLVTGLFSKILVTFF